jgi:hypothetical protein
VTRATAKLLALLAVLLASSACHTFRFQVSNAPFDPKPIVDRKTFWVFAWFPKLEIDMRAICPEGVAAIEEQTTFTDGVFTAFTLNIYSPRTSRYYCKLPPPPPAAPPPAAPEPPAPPTPTPGGAP